MSQPPPQDDAVSAYINPPDIWFDYDKPVKYPQGFSTRASPCGYGRYMPADDVLDQWIHLNGDETDPNAHVHQERVYIYYKPETIPKGFRHLEDFKPHRQRRSGKGGRECGRLVRYDEPTGIWTDMQTAQQWEAQEIVDAHVDGRLTHTPGPRGCLQALNKIVRAISWAALRWSSSCRSTRNLYRASIEQLTNLARVLLQQKFTEMTAKTPPDTPYRRNS